MADGEFNIGMLERFIYIGQKLTSYLSLKTWIFFWSFEMKRSSVKNMILAYYFFYIEDGFSFGNPCSGVVQI